MTVRQCKYNRPIEKSQYTARARLSQIKFDKESKDYSETRQMFDCKRDKIDLQ